MITDYLSADNAAQVLWVCFSFYAANMLVADCSGTTTPSLIQLTEAHISSLGFAHTAWFQRIQLRYD
jgi:hypothetical protein